MQCYLEKFTVPLHLGKDIVRINKCFIKQFSFLKICPAHHMLHCSTSPI